MGAEYYQHEETRPRTLLVHKEEARKLKQQTEQQGVTIVPLDVRVLENGDVYIRAKDPAYANPGPDEAQKF